MMAFGGLATWPPYVLVGTTLVSAGITFAFYRLRCRAWLAAIAGGIAPGATILATCLYLDARLPEGVFYLWFGITLGGLAIFFGLLAAALTAILAVQLSDDAGGSG